MSARVTYVGHATVLFEVAGLRLLTDPVLRPRLLGIIRRAGAVPPGVERDIDAVLVSHQHHDHLDLPSLRRVGAATPVIAPRGSARVLRRGGFETVRELEPGEATRIGEVAVLATPAEHDGRRLKVGRHVPALGFELRAPGFRAYFAGDTDLFDGMSELAEPDLAMLPISGWGPTIRRGHLDPLRAAQAAALLRPRITVPIHWGTLLRADLHRRRPELLHAPAKEFTAHLADLAPEVEARVLEPGATLSLDR